MVSAGSVVAPFAFFMQFSRGNCCTSVNLLNSVDESFYTNLYKNRIERQNFFGQRAEGKGKGRGRQGQELRLCQLSNTPVHCVTYLAIPLHSVLHQIGIDQTATVTQSILPVSSRSNRDYSLEQTIQAEQSLSCRDSYLNRPPTKKMTNFQ